MKKIKKFLCFFMAILMLLSSINISPLIAYATESTEETVPFYFSVEMNEFSGMAKFSIYVDGEQLGNSKMVKTTHTSAVFNVPVGKKIKATCQLVNGEKNAYLSFKEANVVVSGSKSFTVNICGHTGNNRTNEITTEPTYTSAGYEIVRCSTCNQKISENIIPMLTCEHINKRQDILTESTEDTQGLANVYCNDCDKFIEMIRLDLLPHTHLFEYVQVAATCTSPGYTIQNCTKGNCNGGYEKTINQTEKIAHEFGDYEVTVEATCSTDGEKVAKCKYCNTETKSAITALGHTYLSKTTTKATCKSDGIKTFTCSNCNDQYTEVIPKTTVHSYNGTYTLEKEPTCSEYGEKNLYCTICNTLLDTLRVSKLSHTLSWVVTKEATEDETGLKEQKCSVCGKVNSTTIIPKLDCTHSKGYTYITLEAATCSTPKYVKVTCTKCNAVINERLAQDGFDSENHSALSETITKEATETETGLKIISCKDCGYSKEEIIDILKPCDHSRQSKRDVNGVQWWYCKLCDKNLRRADACIHIGYEKIERLDIAATETTKGKVSKLCSNCNAVLSTVDIPAHKAYTIDLGNGETTTVYGYFDKECSEEILELLNIYRTENNLNTLTYASFIQEEADIRAIESAYYFNHTRPNGTKWYTLNSSKMNGENLAAGYRGASAVMVGWKNSEGHNANLLRASFKSVAISTFHQLVFYEGSYIPTERMVYSQEFSCSK